MFCPVCNTQNPATGVHCFQCHTLLIASAEGRTPEVKEAVRSMDSRMYSGVGTMAGFLIGGFVFQSFGAALFAGIAGGVLGRFIARREQDEL